MTTTESVEVLAIAAILYGAYIFVPWFLKLVLTHDDETEFWLGYSYARLAILDGRETSESLLSRLHNIEHDHYERGIKSAVDDYELKQNELR